MMSLRSSPMPDLTDDLVEEILARIPATYLNRLRSICKKWNTLFNDRRFTKKHFDIAEKEYLHLMLCNERLSWMNVNLHGLPDNTDPSAIEFKGEFNLKNFHNKSDDVNDFKAFHCNGFLLCTSSSTTVVWNPCTGQTKWIPTKRANTWDHKYALGYVKKKACHDFKILRFSTNENFELEIFEFNSDSWRGSNSFNPDFKLKASGVSVKGNTYWIAYDNDDVYSDFLIRFDFTTERFGPRVCLPCQGYDYFHMMSLYSVREDRLSLLSYNASKTEIWVTNDIIETNVMSWSKFLRIDFDFPRQLFLPADFFIDEENKSAVVSEYGSFDDDSSLNRTHRVYITGEDRCRKMILEDDPGMFVPHLFTYVPSLVQI